MRNKRTIWILMTIVLVITGIFNFTINTYASTDNVKISNVSSYLSTTMAVDTNGNLWSWNRSEPVIIKENVKKVSQANGVVAYITENDELYMYGKNGNGQLGDGTTTDRSISNAYKVMKNVESVVVDGNLSAAITKDGNLYFWGYADCTYGDNKTTKSLTPVKINLFTNVKSISLSDNAPNLTIAVLQNNGKLYMWGSNELGLLGIGDFPYENATTPQLVMSDVKSVDISDSNAGVVTSNGDVYVWGDNMRGQVGELGMNSAENTPIKKNIGNAKSISVGSSCIGIITENNDLYTWGYAYLGLLGNGIIYEGNYDVSYENYREFPWDEKYNFKDPIKITGEMKEVFLGSQNGFGIDNTGKLWAWGEAPGLGKDSYSNSAVPVLVFPNNIQADYLAKLEGYYSKKDDETSLLKTSYSADLDTRKNELISNILPAKAYAKVRTNPNTVEWHQVEITWNLNNYNGKVEGNYQITGTVELINQTNYVSFDSKILTDIKVSVNVQEAISKKLYALAYPGPNEDDRGKDGEYYWSAYNDKKNYFFDEETGLPVSSTCFGFVQFVTTEVFGQRFTWSGKNGAGVPYKYIGGGRYNDTDTLKQVFSEAKPGDVLVFKKNDLKVIEDSSHVAIFLSWDEEGFNVYEGNAYDRDKGKGLTHYNYHYNWSDIKDVAYVNYVYVYTYDGNAGNSKESVELELSSGWTGVEQECTENDYSNIKIDMQDNKTVPASFLEYSKENDIDVIYDFGNYNWNVLADDIENANDLNFEIREVNNKLPDVTASQLINPLSQLQLTYSGDFGLKALLNYEVGLLYSGRKVTLYYYDEENDSLQKMQTSVVDGKGYVSFDFTHASMYVLDLEDMDSITQSNSDKKKKDCFDRMLDSIDDAIITGKKVVEIDGIEKQISSLPIDIMRYAKKQNISIKFSYEYENVRYTIYIPSSEIIVDETVPWYGPLYLAQCYGKYKADSL